MQCSGTLPCDNPVITVRPRYHGYLVITATSLSRPPRFHGHLIIMDTSLSRLHRHHDYLIITTTSLSRLPRYHGHLVITATSLSRPPRYYDHFILSRIKAQSVIFLFKNPLLRPPVNTNLLWKRVIAWERSRAASGYGIIWGDADPRNKQEEFSAECHSVDCF